MKKTLLLAILGLAASADGKPEVQAILDAYISVYTSPPDVRTATRTPDAPLLGNGDIAVAMGGETRADASFYISKADMNQSRRGVGFLSLSFSGGAGDPSGYRMEQDMYQSLARASIPLQPGAVEMLSWTSDKTNLLVTEVRNRAGQPVEMNVAIHSHDANGAGFDAPNGIIHATRRLRENSDANAGRSATSAVTMAVMALGGELKNLSATGNKTASATLTLPPQQTVRLLTFVGGGRGSTTDVEDAIAGALSFSDNALVDADYRRHLDWWKAYWGKSHIKLNDDLLERFYYGALYSLGCGSREGGVAPGLTSPWGNKDGGAWGNRYTLDYNFQSLFWGIYASNRAELGIPFYDVNLRLIPTAKRMASTPDATKQHDYVSQGVLFGVNALSWGEFADERTLHMKGNAALSLLNFMMHYEYTRDEKFLLRTVWPLLKELELFWSDEKNNLVWSDETKRWTILGSAAREGTPHTNPSNDLAYVTRMFRFLLRHCDTLEGKVYDGSPIHFPQAQKDRWRHYLDHISEMPTMMFNDLKVFKEAESMKRISLGGPGDNTDVLMGVFPAEFVSMGSEPELRQIAYNTAAVMNSVKDKESWFQKNSVAKVYTQAIRAGYPADITMQSLRRILKGEQPPAKDHVRMLHNNTFPSPEHGWESIASIEAINSMMLQSHDDVIRLFPNWLTGQDGHFVNLAAYGAFLVSGAYDGTKRKVTSATITSQKGGTAIIQSPWPDGLTITDSEGIPITATRTTERTTGLTLYTFATKAGETYRLVQNDRGN